MPSYEYKCRVCEHCYEDFHGFNDPHPEKCPWCGEPYGERFGQNYANYNQIGVVKGNPTTVGQQAEINAKRLGKEGMQRMVEAEEAKRIGWKGGIAEGAKPGTATKGETPWFRSGEVAGLPKMDKPLELDKVKNVEKFIKTGDKN